jgi:hypothetical protein
MLRLNKYYEMNTALHYMSTEEIKSKLSSVTLEDDSWGENKIIEIDGTKVFAKKIPVADLFVKNKFQTENLYNLPMHYNYGIGSSGFSPWRELLLHIKTTNFVLTGEMDNFPLLYHYRFIEEQNKKEPNIDKIEEYVEIWNNNPNIKKYLEDREVATMHIILFFEHIEYNLFGALQNKIISYENFLSQAFPIIKFLNKNGILHMDSHDGNYLVDSNGKLYLADFGISIDNKFNLSQDEKNFMVNNSSYDYALSLAILNHFSREEKDKIIANGFQNRDTFDILDNIKELLEMEEVRYRKMLEYKDIITSYSHFITSLKKSPNKETIIFPNDDIKRLLGNLQQYHLIGGNKKYKRKTQKYIKKINNM